MTFEYVYDDPHHPSPAWGGHVVSPWGSPYRQFSEADLDMRHLLGNLADPEREAADTLWHLAAAHGRRGRFVWGPTLVRAVLAGDEPRHHRRTLEERHRIVDVMRRYVHRSHQDFAGEPSWLAASLLAVEECRGPFLAGAITQEELARERRVAAFLQLTGGVEPRDLDLTPLPAQELDLTDVRADIVERVRGIDRLVGQGVRALARHASAEEIRTAARRVLRRAALGEPDLFVRKSRDDYLAAGLLIVLAEGNGVPRMGAAVRGALGITTGNVGHRGTDLLRAAGTRTLRRPCGIPSEAECAWKDYRDVVADPTLQTADTRRLIEETYALAEAECRGGDVEERPAAHDLQRGRQ